MDFVIEKATVTQAKAKVALVGPAGSGKTMTALILARELGERTLVIDTENKTSAKYANDFEFDILPLTEYKLTTYIAALEYAADLGYNTVIIDSLSHAWVGSGGALEQVDNTPGKSKFSSGWKVVTPLHNKLIETILTYPTHLIATIRMKMDYILTTNERGQQVPQKAGLGIVQRDGIEYEFDVIAEMDVAHNLAITKTRCSALDGFAMSKPDGTLGQAINAWLSEGTDIPVWPDGWYPSKEQFFKRVKDERGLSYKVIAEKLKVANFTDYKPGLAADMWRALEPDVTENGRQDPAKTELEELYPEILGDDQSPDYHGE
jgi:hypothetical protein